MKKFKIWSTDENHAWKKLSSRQIPNLQDKVSQLWLHGFDVLNLNTDLVPDFDQLALIVKTISRWQLKNSDQQFADGQTWFTQLRQSHFLITDYIRPSQSLDYTPMPDVFHDAFGHLPFLMDEQFTRIVRKFSKLMLSLKGEKKVMLGHIWWYTIEFGLIKEEKQVKALGAGLASSFGEINKVFSGQTQLKAFDSEIVGQTQESPGDFHEILFVLESLDQLEQLLDNWPTT